MEEVYWFGGGREVGRLEFPKKFGFKDFGKEKKEKEKSEAWERRQ